MTAGRRAVAVPSSRSSLAAALVGRHDCRADVTAQGCPRGGRRRHGGTGSARRSIHFDGTINGIDALQLAGANPVTYGFAGQGAAVCQLYGVGNPADGSCLIGPGGQYWAYFRAAPGAGGWTYSRGCACVDHGRRRRRRGLAVRHRRRARVRRLLRGGGLRPHRRRRRRRRRPRRRSTNPRGRPAGGTGDATRRGDDGHHGRAVVGQGGQERRRRDRSGHGRDDRHEDGGPVDHGRSGHVDRRAPSRRRRRARRTWRSGERLGRRFGLTRRGDRRRRRRGARRRRRGSGLRRRRRDPRPADPSGTVRRHGDTDADLRSGKPREPRRQRLLRPVHRARAESTTRRSTRARPPTR